MAIYVAQSEYGIALEETNGTALDPSQGIPQEGLITLNLGTEYANTPKMQGVPYARSNEYVDIGKMPGATGFSHNLSPQLLQYLLASMHGTPGDESTNVFTLGHGDTSSGYPATGAVYTNGSTDTPYTISLKHQTGETDEDHRIGGCVCSNLTLTFPASGGPVKMGYDLVGLTSADSVASAGTYTLETTGADAIASDFAFSYGTPDSTTLFYPEGDVTINLRPELVVTRRGEEDAYKIIVHRWGGSFSFGWPWDAAADVDALSDDYTGGTFAELLIYNNLSPDTIGEYSIKLHGRLLTPPSLEGEGIVQERAEFELLGSTTEYPYEIKFYDSVLS